MDILKLVEVTPQYISTVEDLREYFDEEDDE